MNVLSLEGVTLAYPDGPGTVVGLDRLTLAVGDGEFVAVMGPSGSGKTTLVNVCCGLERPTAGGVVVDGVDLGSTSPRQRALLRRSRIGVVHQTDDLDPVLRVVENVALPLVLGGIRRRDALDLAVQALDRCRVGDLADRYRDQLSGGQRQRVALARAVVGERVLVLADEPTASLDTAAARDLVQFLVVLAGEGTAVLMTTHDARLATFADRVVLLRDGSLVEPSIESAVGSSSAPPA